MSAALKTLVALDEGLTRGSVQAALPPESALEVVGFVERLEESWKALDDAAPDVLIVACSDSSERALHLVETAAKQSPERPVVVFRFDTGDANGFMHRVFEAGAEDIVSLRDEPERIVETLRKAVARRQGAMAATAIALAPLICVLGPKGGTGKTVTACNLALALADAGQRAFLVDLDLRFGDVALGLHLSPERTIYDLARSGGSLDAEKLDGFLATHPSGVRALLAPLRPDQASAVSVEFLAQIFPILRKMSDYVIVDTPAGFPPEVIASVDGSTDVCLVGTLDSFSLKGTKLALETLALMGYDGERIRLVLNRADSRVGISRQDAALILGRSPDVLVPNDRAIPRSVNEGVPIVRSHTRSAAAKAFRDLAALYLGHELPVDAESGNGLLSSPLLSHPLRLLRRA